MKTITVPIGVSIAFRLLKRLVAPRRHRSRACSRRCLNCLSAVEAIGRRERVIVVMNNKNNSLNCLSAVEAIGSLNGGVHSILDDIRSQLPFGC